MSKFINKDELKEHLESIRKEHKDTKSFSDMIKEILRIYEISNAEFARKTGLAPTMVSKITNRPYKTGKSYNPGLDVVTKIWLAFPEPFDLIDYLIAISPMLEGPLLEKDLPTGDLDAIDAELIARGYPIEKLLDPD